MRAALARLTDGFGMDMQTLDLRTGVTSWGVVPSPRRGNPRRGRRHAPPDRRDLAAGRAPGDRRHGRRGAAGLARRIVVSAVAPRSRPRRLGREPARPHRDRSLPAVCMPDDAVPIVVVTCSGDLYEPRASSVTTEPSDGRPVAQRDPHSTTTRRGAIT